MEAAVLETIYTASDAEFQKITAAVEKRFKDTVKTGEVSLREQQRAAEQLHKQRSASLMRQWQEEQRAAERAAKAEVKAATDAARAMSQAMTQAQREADRTGQSRARSGDNLLGLIPGGSRVTQFRSIADDIKNLTGAAEGGKAAISDLGAAGLGAAAGVAVLTVGLVAAGFAVAKSVSLFSDYANQIHDLGQESGLAAETLSTVDVYARLAGATVEQAANSFQIYLRNAAEAANGNKAMAATFKRFGIDATEALRDPDQAAQNLLDTLAKIPNSAERLDAANKLAGRSGKVLASIAQEMGGSFAEARRQAEQWGVVLSEDDVRAADKLGDSIEIMKMKAEGAIYKIAREVMPELTKSVKELDGALSDDLTIWEKWGMGAAVQIARVRGVMEGFADWWRGNSWSPWEMGKALERGRDREQGEFIHGLDERHGYFDLNRPASDEQQRRGAEERGRAMSEMERARGGGAGNYAVQKSGGANAAKRTAQLALEAARIVAREAESLFRDQLETQQRSYDRGLESLGEYNDKRVELENDRYEKVKDVFAKERAALSGLNGKEGDVKRQDVDQREAEAERQHQQTLAKIGAEGYEKRLEIDKRYRDERLRISAQMSANEVARLMQSVSAGERTNEEVEERRFQLERLQFAERMRDALVEESRYVTGDPDKLKAAQNAVEAILQEMDAALTGHVAHTRDARESDLQSAQRYAQGLRSVYAEIADINAEIMQTQIDALGENSLNRRAATEAQRVLNQAREAARSGRELADLHERRRAQDLNPNRVEAASNIRAINARIEAEERLHQARMVEIDHQANEERRRQLIEIGNDIAGILTAGLEQFDGTWSSVWRGMLQEALGVLREIGAELMRMAFTGQGSKSGGLVGFLVNTIGGALLGKVGVGGGGAAAGGSSGGVNVGGMSLGPPRLKFARGGSFMVGGPGGTDSQHVEFMASPEERVTVETPEQQRAGRGGAYHDNRKYITLVMPPSRAASTYKSRSGRREAAEDILSLLGR